MTSLILASSSIYRRQILEQAGIKASYESPDVDETPLDSESPEELVLRLALRKARAIAVSRPAAWVLGFDQVAIDPQDSMTSWGKPKSPEQHFERLSAMRGKAHKLVSGCCVLVPGQQPDLWRSTTVMTVRKDLTDDELWAYVRTGEGSQCSGGYAAEGRGSFLFSSIDGDWFNVLGLPLFDVITRLRRHGWRFHDGR